MIPHKPKNHVQEVMETIRQDAATGTVWPDIPEDLVDFLDATFPPRCYQFGAEALEEHLLYAGSVALVQVLRGVFERQAKEAEDDAEDGSEESYWADRAAAGLDTGG
ncbi:hypothetical protein [Methylobacterium ajmalii]|jgi:hypothetical protein|uniref:hypothetical protein n=1 Tax=Methylobacterium ajmalii TaxID=2738439 RepID=UPI00190D7AA8|nr:hypothetical protein [Methylobacterium ajmalii]MBK3400432.1 hypothetical protein [Methylobacterium ajmalii]MBK3407526.1 hypothetical protein [Methylobacterium ajmalii]MBK3422126.1 hypothetical protein [Methylobacterium ajmalii]MBZ6416643.1 hypothetical protein [Methylobacterium sp.]